MHGVHTLETGDTCTLNHPAAGNTVWTITETHNDGRCDIRNQHGADLRCRLTDLKPHTESHTP